MIVKVVSEIFIDGRTENILGDKADNESRRIARMAKAWPSRAQMDALRHAAFLKELKEYAQRNQRSLVVKRVEVQEPRDDE